MLGRNGNTAYVKYDSQNRIVPGGPIISSVIPKNGNWQAVSDMIGNNTIGSNGNILRAFIRLDMFGRVVPSSLVIQTKKPSDANSGTGWLEINAFYRGLIRCDYGTGSATFEGYYTTTSTTTTQRITTVNIYARNNTPGEDVKIVKSLNGSIFDTPISVPSDGGLIYTLNVPIVSPVYFRANNYTEGGSRVGLALSNGCYPPYGFIEECQVGGAIIEPNENIYISINSTIKC